MNLKKYILSLIAIATLSTPAFGYPGANEIIIDKGATKLHIIDYYKVMVVLSIKDRSLSVNNIECGIFPLNEKTRTSKFGENIVYFGNKEYGYINNIRKFYSSKKLDLTLYRKHCNNFKIR